MNGVQRWVLTSAEQASRIQAEVHYQQAQLLLQSRDWAAAEGLLWHLRQQGAWAGVVLIDQPLACTLVMQGEHPWAWELLEPLLVHPQRNFWVAHLAADALRACNRLAEAGALYRQALADGSDSPLTARNLLQVLWQQDEAEALEQLRLWQQERQLHGTVLQGVQEALAAGQAPVLEQWLADQQLATPQQLQRLVIAAIQRLDRPAIQRGLAILQDDSWAQGLRLGLQALGVEGFQEADFTQQ